MHATHWVSVVVVCSREKKSFFLNVFLSFAIEVFVCGCAQDAFDSIHKTPIENYRPNCIFIREKQTEKPANQWRKVCAFFFHSLLLSCSTFLLFISLRLSSLVWHSIVFFRLLCLPSVDCALRLLLLLLLPMQWAPALYGYGRRFMLRLWRWHDKINESMKQQTSITTPYH